MSAITFRIRRVTRFLRETLRGYVRRHQRGCGVSITATSPIVVTPSPITGTGVVSHAASGVTAATYGDTTHYPIVTFDADGHATSASNQLLPSNGVLQSLEFLTSGTFNVPTGVTMVWVTMVGAGGGGCAIVGTTTSAGGGGSGELVQGLAVNVTSGGTVTVTVEQREPARFWSSYQPGGAAGRRYIVQFRLRCARRKRGG